MIGLKVKDGIVTQSAVFEELPSGWYESIGGAGIGWSSNGDGTFSRPSQPDPTIEDVINSERGWRDMELQIIDIEILKAEDTGVDTATLRAYRQALRNYPQQGDFPNGTRPVA